MLHEAHRLICPLSGGLLINPALEARERGGWGGHRPGAFAHNSLGMKQGCNLVERKRLRRDRLKCARSLVKGKVPVPRVCGRPPGTVLWVSPVIQELFSYTFLDSL